MGGTESGGRRQAPHTTPPPPPPQDSHSLYMVMEVVQGGEFFTYLQVRAAHSRAHPLLPLTASAFCSRRTCCCCQPALRGSRLGGPGPCRRSSPTLGCPCTPPSP